MKIKSAIIIFTFLIIKTLSKDKINISTPIPENGTFVFSQFSDSNCTTLIKMRGFIPQSEKWNKPTEHITEMKLLKYTNDTGELIYEDINNQAYKLILTQRMLNSE